jgi:hypothetical protein
MLVCAEHCCVRSRRAGRAAALGNAADGFMDCIAQWLDGYRRDQSCAPVREGKEMG